MKILGIDTATKFLCIGVYDNGKVSEYNLLLDRQHLALLVPAIKRILQALGWQPEDLDYLACGLGPGSFTGSRIGVSAIKGLAWSLQKPAIGVSTLDNIACNIAAEGDILVASDAKRGLVYGCFYRHKNGQIKRTSDYLLLKPEELAKKAKPKCLVTADALDLYRQVFLKGIKRCVLADKDYWQPQGRNIIRLALEKIERKEINNSFDLEPVYLYPQDCQVVTRHKAQGTGHK